MSMHFWRRSLVNRPWQSRIRSNSSDVQKFIYQFSGIREPQNRNCRAYSDQSLSNSKRPRPASLRWKTSGFDREAHPS